jgi:hypothetical protein
MNPLEKIGSSVDKRIEYAKRLQGCLNGLRLKTYSSIHTCSIFIWFQIRETGDISLLLKEKNKVKNDEIKCLRMIYMQMLDEYIKLKGDNEEENKLRELTNEIIERVQKRIIENDNSQWTWIDIAKQKIDDMVKSNPEKNDLFKMKVTLEKIVGVPINVYQCSVADFYGYVKFAEEQNNSME